MKELQEGTVWTSCVGGDPLSEYLKAVHQLFEDLQKEIAEETSKRLEKRASHSFAPPQRGAVWTYLTTDELFGGLGVEMPKGKNIGYAAASLVYSPISVLDLFLARLWRRMRRS